MVAMHGVLIRYLSTSWKAWVKEAEDRVVGFDRCHAEVAEQESKLKNELVTLWNSYDSRESIFWGLQAWITEKDWVLARERAQVADIEAWLDRNEVLLWLADEKA